MRGANRPNFHVDAVVSFRTALVHGVLLGCELLEVSPVHFPLHGEGPLGGASDHARGDAVQGGVAAADDYPFSLPSGASPSMVAVR